MPKIELKKELQRIAEEIKNYLLLIETKKKQVNIIVVLMHHTSQDSQKDNRMTENLPKLKLLSKQQQHDSAWSVN